jgi:hypothetical protein
MSSEDCQAPPTGPHLDTTTIANSHSVVGRACLSCRLPAATVVRHPPRREP